MKLFKPFFLAFLIFLAVVVPVMAGGPWLREDTATTVVVGPFLDNSTGVPTTSLTIAQADVQISKNALSFAQKNDATSCSHIGGGMYACDLNITDTNTLGDLSLYVDETGSSILYVYQHYEVVPANVYDTVISGTDYLDINAVEVSGSSTAADNAEVIFDTDFATNYSTANDKWQVESDVQNIEGSDATDQIGDAVWNEVTESTYTAREMFRIMFSVLAGKSAGGGTSTITFRDIVDGLNRVSATVDGSGNRTSVSIDGTE